MLNSIKIYYKVPFSMFPLPFYTIFRLSEQTLLLSENNRSSCRTTFFSIKKRCDQFTSLVNVVQLLKLFSVILQHLCCVNFVI